MRTARPALACALLLAGCSSAAPAARPASHPPITARPAPRPVARCAWYSPTTRDGQQVIVAATGPACGDPPLVDWIVTLTRRTWISTGYVHGACIAQLARAGAAVQVWQTGFAATTSQVAGRVADTLEHDGWTVQVPPSGGPTPPPLPTPIGAAG